MPAQDLTTIRDTSRIESVRVVILVHDTHLFNVLYNLMKYHENISNGLSDMAFTSFIAMGGFSRMESELSFFYATNKFYFLYILAKY